MTAPSAYILVHPGSFIAHCGDAAFEEILAEMGHHVGPVYLIDGFLSDKTAPHDAKISEILELSRGRGFDSGRLWGCDAGEDPFPGWSGLDEEIHDSQQDAAASLSTRIAGMDLQLSGAWATRDGSSGCVNSVAQALRDAGWSGTSRISDLSLFEEDVFANMEDEQGAGQTHCRGPTA